MFEHFSHEADVGIRGKGRTIEQAFEEIAKAMFDVEVNIKKVKAKNKIQVKASAENNEELLIEWLNALLSQASLKEVVFSKFKVKIKNIKKAKNLKLVGEAWGEKLKQEHKPKDEIKGATYSQLKVKKQKDGWIAQCIVDV